MFSVEDGNTVTVSKSPDAQKADHVLRFYGVTAPTLRQPCGKEALAFLHQVLPKGTSVGVDVISEEKDGPMRALVQLRGDTVNYQMVTQGLAWVNRQECKAVFCRRWYIQEHQAVQERRGIWRLNIGTPPWQWGNR
ncbi:MAG: thermonuclease family protein [Desulfovibrio sp.]|nr:thermonuclease family protein [Desulfovibrio sp.]